MYNIKLRKEQDKQTIGLLLGKGRHIKQTCDKHYKIEHHKECNQVKKGMKYL